MAQSNDQPSRDRSTGAYSIGEKKRRAGWLIPLLLLLGALAIGLLLWALLANRDDDKDDAAAAVASPSASAPITPTASPTNAAGATDSPAANGGTEGATGTAAPTDAANGGVAGTGAGAGAAALVGGGSVAAHRANGAQAAAGQLGTVLFATDSAALNPEARKVIAAAAAAIKAKGSGTVTVTGYADVVGGQPVNNELTQQRADAVRTALESAAGTSGVDYQTASKGAADPVATNSTEAGRQQNRRATITIA